MWTNRINRLKMKNIYKYILGAIILASSVNGCGLYKAYERPATAFTDSLYRRLPHNTDTSTIATLSWEELFTDPELQEWIKLGLKHNTDLNIARFRIEAAEATMQAARMAYIPGVNFAAKGSAGNSGSSSYSAGPSFSWEADIFGRLTNAKRKAAMELEQSHAYKQAVQTQLVSSIAKSYYTLVMLDEQLSISQRTLTTWEENIRTLEALKRAGKTNEAAVLQAKANKLSVEASVLTLHKQIFEAENAFCALIGIVPMTIQRTRMEEQVFPQRLSEGIPAQMLSRRPDVRQAELEFAQAYYSTNIARAAFYPKVVLDGSAIFNPSGFIANLAANLAQPIFAQGANKAQLRRAKAQQDEALYNFRQCLLDAGVEVNNAIVIWETAKERTEIDRKQILHLRAAVWNTQLLMKHGQATYIEVLTAQKNLLQAELSEVSDRFDTIHGIISLYRALGGGY